MLRTCKIFKVSAITSNVKVFKGIESAKPLTVEEGGIQAPFDIKSFGSAMAKGTEYICECNLFWLMLTFLSMANIPTDMVRVKRLMNHYFKSPDRPRKPIIVSVPTRDYDPLAHRGALRSPSPEEVIHAFLLAVHRDFKGNASDDVMKEWRNCTNARG